MMKYNNDLLIHHDDTLDRVTDGAGSAGGTTGVRSLGDYKALTVDQYSATNQDIPATLLKLLSADEFIDKYGQSAGLNFEPKYTQTSPNLAKLLHEHRAIPNTIVYVTNVTDRDYLIGQGVRVMTADAATEAGTKTPAQLEAIGVHDIAGYVAPGDAAGMAALQPYLDAGIRSWLSGQRRTEWTFWRQYPEIHIGGYSDAPLWTAGRSPVYTTDQFADRVHLAGHIPYTYGFPGNFKDLGSGVWGWSPNANQNGWCLWGWCSPHPKGGHGEWDILNATQEIKDPDYPFGIEFDLTHVGGSATSNWAAIAFANDDMPVHDSRSASSNTSGRHVLIVFINTLGNVYVIDVMDAVANQVVLGNDDLGAIGLGNKHRYRLEYLSATSFKVTDLTTSESVTSTIPENLGTNGYINAGTPAAGASGEWAFSSIDLF